METIFHSANSRGSADHGWLKSKHTFSFASYYNPERMGFGVLRVINDDIIAPTKGFDTHPHRDMEIVSIPIAGSLKHKDSMGNEHIISKGEIQAMSAGTGILHSEYNNSSEEEANFLQIWILPKKLGIEPAYSQKKFSELERRNKFQLVVSPDGRENSVSINQDAFFYLANLDSNSEVTYQLNNNGNGIYFFVIEGSVTLGDQTLNKRDAVALKDHSELKIKAKENSEILLMEISMTAN